MHKYGMYVGRFQPFHKGHYKVVLRALEECEHLIIVIGSAQEAGTEKNPFSFELRERLIRRALRGKAERVTIIGVNDRPTISDDSSWGTYLLGQVYGHLGIIPTISFEGIEEIRSHWFDGIEITRCLIDRDVMPISATLVRKALKEDDFYAYSKAMPTGCWFNYSELRKRIGEIKCD
jgi:nicotinamide-nucleotide adenylyltransferase